MTENEEESLLKLTSAVLCCMDTSSVGSTEDSMQHISLDAATSWPSHISDGNKGLVEGEAPSIAPDQVPTKAWMNITQVVTSPDVADRVETESVTHHSLKNQPSASFITSGTKDVKADLLFLVTMIESGTPFQPLLDEVADSLDWQQQQCSLSTPNLVKEEAYSSSSSSSEALPSEDLRSLMSVERSRCSPPRSFALIEDREEALPSEAAPRCHHWLKKSPLGRILRGLKGALRMGKACAVRGLMRMACMGGEQQTRF